MRYLVDADSTIDHLSQRVDLLTRLRIVAADDLALSAITLIELYTGVYGGRDPTQAQRDLERFLQAATIVPVSERVILRTARLRTDLLSRRLPIKHRAYDLIVAATALEYGLTVVSSNERDYQDIPGLQLLNPRQRP